MAKAVVKYRTRVVKAKHRKKAGFTLPLAVVGGFVPILTNTYYGYKSGGIDGATQKLVAYTTGYSRWEGKFRLDALIQGMAPVLAGILVHKVAGKLGVNRALSNAGIPFVRI